MTKQTPIQKTNYKFDLEERTANLSEDLIELIKSIKESSLNRNIISQLIRSGTNVGANYCEANDFLSKKDFLHRIAICRKEAKEAQELNLIFSAIIIRSREKQN